MMNNEHITRRQAQQSAKPAIQTIAVQQLSGNLLKEFEEFHDFLKQEKISLPWKSINGYKMKYKGKDVGAISFDASGSETKNYIWINIHTVAVYHKDLCDFDLYLDGQSGEVTDLFMEQINNKCVHCRPTCGCSTVSGQKILVAGKQHENVCMNAPMYKFIASGDSMRSVMMCTPNALYPPIEVRPVPLDIVKKLILARNEYIVKC